MFGGDLHAIETVFLSLLLLIVVFAIVASKVRTPYPIVMVIGGLLLAFVPGTPQLVLNPDAVFLVVLPPLLYAAAWQTSWREFRHNIVSVGLLAFGLVAFTVLAVAYLAHFIVPEFSWQLGFVLGAVVATTDAIAATSIAKRLHLPQRIVDVLEGESLLNDASGLLALEFGIGMIVRNENPTVSDAAMRLAWLTIGGIGVGLLVGVVADRIERLVEDGPVEITLSIFIPYATYLLAEEVHASGVLAVVACGLFLSRKSSEFFSPGVRIQAWAVWESLTFLMNGVVFVIIGLQLPYVRAAIQGRSLWQLIWAGLLFSLLVILLRLAWTFPGAYLAHRIRKVFNPGDVMPPLRQVFVVGWTGMRGVVALAAALALPATTEAGAPFPQRDMILFLAFFVILFTLVAQGITLPGLIRVLGLTQKPGPNCEEREARTIMLHAAMTHLEQLKVQDAEYLPVYEDLERHYLERLASVRQEDGDGDMRESHERHSAATRELLQVERRTAVQLRNDGRINDEILRRLERELDLGEAKMQGHEHQH